SYGMSEPTHILLVDDQARNLDALEAVLASPDYRLVRAQSANEALLALLTYDFAVIVLDIRMPEIDGYELAQMIKQRKKNQHLPIIFLTAYLQDDRAVLEGYGAGAVDYLTKPINPLILRSKVAVFVDLFRKTRELARLNEIMESEIEERVAQVRASLREKEILLKEVHHRVKNNMQIISSLQAERAGATQRDFRDVRDRVRSMALVHEKLYQSENLACVQIAEYARSLINDLFQAYASGLPKVQLRLDLESAELPVDRAISFGLILNELATNAFKHAFRDRHNGEIEIKLQTVPQGDIRLRFADNGRGFAAPSSWESADTLGLRLLRMLTRQLGGQIEMRSDRGTTVELSFKIDPARDSPGANQPRVSS
ncbi:MAG: sensor histidine kinase, partial [Candidatus Binatia bacterium]